MSWVCSQTRFKGPVKENTVLFVGLGDDAGFISYMPEEVNGAYEIYTISEQVSFSLYTESTTLIRENGLINEKAWYRSASGALQIYYTSEFGWVMISTSFFPGYVPNEYQNEYDVWQGQFFYSASTIPSTSSTSSVTFTGRGTLKNESTVPTTEVSFFWPRWVKTTSTSSPYGVYTAVSDSGATGTKVLGLPKWLSGATEFIRSLVTASWHYTYGSVHYDTTHSVWIIGTYGDGAGWWEGDEPSVSSPTTFTFTVPEGSEVTGDDKTLTFSDYVLGENTMPVYMGELGAYR